MRGWIKFILVFTAIVLLSACLAPILYPLLPYKFERIFNRLVMIFSLAALLVFLKGRRLRMADYGLSWQGITSVRTLLAGFLTGVLALALFSFFKVKTGLAVWTGLQGSAGFWVLRFAGDLGAAFLIAFIEEFFFRGFIYRSLTAARLPLPAAVVLTSLFYALIHFVSFEKPFVDASPTFFDALRVAGAPVLSLFQFGRYWPEALGLFLFGLVLNHAALKAHSLYPAIGLHAGCVLYVKTDELFLKFEERSRLIYSSGKFYDGLLGWGFIMLIGICLSLVLGLLQKRKVSKNFIFLVFAGLLAASAPAAAEEEIDSHVFMENENSPYSFSVHLPTDASADLIKPEVYSKKGIWTEDRFVFPGATAETDLIVNQEVLDGKPIEVMKFQTFGSLHRTLRFENVTPSARLVFYFKVAPLTEALTAGGSSVYLRFFVGRKLINRIRLGQEDGWVKRVFSLDSARFLKQSLRVLIEVRADDNTQVVTAFGYVK